MTARRCLVVAFALLAGGTACAQGCGGLANHYGPFDYRVERYGKLQIVEHYHFAPEVEALVHGESSSIGDDLNYVLMTSPNHHRALLATVRYAERLKTSQPPDMRYSVDCYFDRALRFQRDDTVVREMFAEYLVKGGHPKEAHAQLDAAVQYAKDNALSHYNIGLIYFELRDYDQALGQAQTALQLGYVRPELKQMLEGVGKWRDPPASAPAASAPPSATAASAASSSP